MATENKNKVTPEADGAANTLPDTEQAKVITKEILEQAKTEAARILAEAETKKNRENEKAVEAPAKDDDELVTVRLFRDSGKYKSDLFVAVNGESCLIKRGEPVQIKKKFARVIEQGLLQDQLASKLIEKEEEKFHTNKEALN